MSKETVERVKGEIIDSMHWKSYTIIRQNFPVEGCLTQESEQRIVDKILSHPNIAIISDDFRKEIVGIQNKITMGMSSCATCRQDDCYNCDSLNYPQEIADQILRIITSDKLGTGEQDDKESEQDGS